MINNILFKAKRLDNNQWIQSNSILQDSFSTDCKFWVNGEGWVKVDEKTLCRFTCLSDINGKNVFENDIVQFMDYKIDEFSDEDIEFVNIGKIIFANGQFIVTNLSLNEMDEMIIGNNCLGAIVIGNCFDNPSLLKDYEN